MEARAWLGNTPGGKSLTEELPDANADYSINRNEIQSEFELLLSEKGNIRMIAAHRSIIEKGTEQRVSSTHCFSCHLTSRSAEVDRRTHMFQVGIDAQPGQFELGYRFGFSDFRSEADQPIDFYDRARHPVNGGSGDEFSSRLIYDDTIMAYGIYPKTEKFSHKGKLKGDLGKGRVAATVGYSTSENDVSDLQARALSGALTYSVPLSRSTRLIARASAINLEADDPYIELPLWRRDRPGESVDFSFTRYSSLDRIDARGSAEVITRLNPKFTFSLLAGFNSIKRDDYPEFETDYSTSRLIGQVKARYREGLKYSGRFKYRFEKTSDPFVSGRGLFERKGREELEINVPPGFAFYYQREDLRYQSITTEPTDRHEFDLFGTIRPTLKSSFNFGMRADFEKNSELDSLDVEHSLLQPSVSLSLTPNTRWVLTGGYVFNHYKSRGPITVALFDG
jgi:hypothetical protein